MNENEVEFEKVYFDMENIFYKKKKSCKFFGVRSIVGTAKTSS